MSDDEPKSAVELAMERLRKQDAEQGIVARPLSDDQKLRIDEVWRAYRAKVAHLEIMKQSQLARGGDPETCAALEVQYRRDVERAQEERDRALEKIRREVPGV